jgi:hypothetical protein
MESVGDQDRRGGVQRVVPAGHAEREPVVRVEPKVVDLVSEVRELRRRTLIPAVRLDA